MSTVTKPMALDETFNTTESTPRNQADVLAGIQQAIREGFGQVAYAVEYDNTDSGLTATNVQDAIDEVDAALDVVEDDIESIEDDIESIKEVTGNPITLTDAAPINAESLVVELEPKQDLHGYDYPWVGGAGKNKLPMTVANLKSWNTSGAWSGNVYSIYNTTIEIITDETNVNVHGLKINTGSGGASDVVIFKLSSESHTFNTGDIISGCPTGGATNKYMLNIGGTNDSDIGNGGVCSSDRVGVMNLDIFRGAQLTNSMWYPMVSTEGGNFAPYSNICPISGYDEVGLDIVGINQWDEEWELGDYNDSGQATSVNYCIRSKQDDYIPILGNTGYYSKCSENIYPCFYDINKTFISKIQVNADTTFTTPANARYMRFVIHSNYGTTYNHDISINYPATDTNYHPYQSRTASVTFGQTVYGGKVDFLTGKVTVDSGKKTISELSFTRETPSGRSRYVAVFSEIEKKDVRTMANLYSDRYETISDGRSYANSPDYCIFNRPAGGIYINDQRYSSVEDFVAANGDSVIVYPLAEPFTIQLTPEELKLLQDTNNITTNGTTINLDYIPNNSIGDAVKASEEYTDRAVGRVAPKATLIDTWMISEESDTISVDLTAYDCNFFLLEYLFQSKRGTTLIPRPQGGTFSASVVTYNNGTAYYIELDYNPTTKQLAYTSNITSQFGVLAIYTI